MAAVVQISPRPDESSSSRALKPAPALRVLEGGRSEQSLRMAAVYRRRRIISALAVLTVAVLGFLVVQSSIAGSSPVGASTGVGAPAAATHVVRSGETLWEIARSLEVGGDVRDVVDRLAEINGGPVIRVGQELVIPASLFE